MGLKSNRRYFVKQMGVTALGLSILPNFSWTQSSDNLSHDILLGLQRPDDIMGVGYSLRSDASNAFMDMKKAAKADGIDIYSQSSYRSFEHQKNIWERKYRKYQAQGLSGTAIIKKIIMYSTIPGTSRHHWGTDLDIIDRAVSMPSNPLNEKHYIGKGVYSKLYSWMLKNAGTYGFHEAYTKNTDRKGFNYEPWHWSFAPLSQVMLKEYLKINLFSVYEKQSFLGHELLSKEVLTEYTKNHVLGINPLLVLG